MEEAEATKADRPQFMLENMGRLVLKVTRKDREGKVATRTIDLGKLSEFAGNVGEYTLQLSNDLEGSSRVLSTGHFDSIYSIL